jgi:hypothetical protein
MNTIMDKRLATNSSPYSYAHSMPRVGVSAPDAQSVREILYMHGDTDIAQGVAPDRHLDRRSPDGGRTMSHELHFVRCGA